ncbi:MAG: hypothetical protein AB2L11_07965 [Syntrophobacteraceae bacterium]
MGILIDILTRINERKQASTKPKITLNEVMAFHEKRRNKAAKGLLELGATDYGKMSDEAKSDYEQHLKAFLTTWILSQPAFQQVLVDRVGRLGEPCTEEKAHDAAQELLGSLVSLE